MALANCSEARCDALPDALPEALASAGSAGRGAQRSTGAAGRRAGSAPSPVPGGGDPGLSARLSSLAGSLASFVSDLEPGCLLGRDAAALYGDLCRLERLVVAAKTLLAPRIAESGHWEQQGHRSAAGLLATLEGGSAGRARRTLEAGRRLAELPGLAAAVRTGSLSGPKVDELTRAAASDPTAEGALLAGSDAEPLHVVKERCQAVRAAAAGADPAAALARIHARRSFTTWTDAEGAFCFSGRDSADRGARMMARLVPVADRLRADRRAAGRAGATPAGSPESEAALRADALYLVVTGRRPVPPAGAGGGDVGAGGPDPVGGGAVPGAPGGTVEPDGPDGPDGPDAGPTPGLDASAPANPAGLGSADDLVGAAPPATVIVRVDLAALRRGRARPGELCELDGLGPVPVPVATGLVDDAFLALVFTEAGDIRAVSHLGRTINRRLRTALAVRDRRCVVPGCPVAYGLEIDHVHPLESGGRTELSNLALLCHHHHRMKTYDGWVLERTGPTDEDPRWRFTPQPPFGQEPGLGLDRPPDAPGSG